MTSAEHVVILRYQRLGTGIDVFLSYKHDERSAIEKIASSLRSLGLTVWFDASLSAGESFNAEIDREARTARVILVCWSPAARQSEWINAEAMIGFTQKKLAACLVAGPDKFDPPTPFNTTQVEDLREWLVAGAETHSGWKSVLRRVGKLCERRDIESWGSLSVPTTNAMLRNWIAANERSQLRNIAEALLQSQLEQERERERQEQTARELARKEAERLEQERLPEQAVHAAGGGQVSLVVVGIGLLAVIALAATQLGGRSIPQATPNNAEIEHARSKESQRAAAEFERRSEVLRSLLDYAGGTSMQLAATHPVERDGARIIMAASIDEGEARQSRADSGSYQVTTSGFRASGDRLEADQDHTLSELEDQVAERSEQVRGVLRMTGVSMASLSGNDEAGGPLVPQDFVAYLRDSGLNPAFAQRVTQVAARVTESRRLSDIANSTPLARPVAVDYRETSGYGQTVGPTDCGIDVGDGFHSGLDITAVERGPVVATAPGVVVFAGTREGYGYTVEIDHGHGFKTRYATLRDIQVRGGDRVGIGQRIGTMGATGRSTTAHVHYEVWFRGRAVDPLNFLRAGRHVHEHE